MDHAQTNLSEIRLPPTRWSIMYLRKSLTKFCPTLRLCLIVRIRSMSHRQARSELALRESELQQKVEEVAKIMIMMIMIMILIIMLMSKMVILIIMLMSKMVMVMSSGCDGNVSCTSLATELSQVNTLTENFKSAQVELTKKDEQLRVKEQKFKEVIGAKRPNCELVVLFR